MPKKLLLCFLLFGIFSCGQDDRREKEIAEIPVEVEVKRFDQRFARATADSLPVLKEEFPYLFPSRFSDEEWVLKMRDTIQLELNTEVEEAFSDFSDVRQELKLLFQHVKYYFPNTRIPDVITLTSEVDYRNKVIWSDELLLIALDNYLGQEHHFYLGMQEYLKKNFERDQIVVDAASAFGGGLVQRPESRSFLAHMVYYGKILYLKDLLVPFKTDWEKMGYTKEEYEWAQRNEEEIWRYFVERELLFDTDSELQSRFLFPAPFSKFYLQLDNESPAMVGQYIGWQIVRKYMENRDVGLNQLLITDAQTIFNLSNYKPKK